MSLCPSAGGKRAEGKQPDQQKFRTEVFDTMLEAGRTYGDGSPFVSEEYLQNRNPVLRVPAIAAS